MTQRQPRNPPRARPPESSPDISTPRHLYIGPAGWSYPDWTGYVYPSRRPKGFHEATYLAEFFDTIEINTSFYQPLRPDHAAQWLDRVAANPRFVFTAKLWQRFTHDSAPSASLSAAADERAVRAGFDVLRAANKLGAVLLQFPFSFHRTKETVAYLSSLLNRFSDYPLVVEVRHASWNSPETLGSSPQTQRRFLQYRSAHHRPLSHPFGPGHFPGRLHSPSRPPLRHLVHR